MNRFTCVFAAMWILICQNSQAQLSVGPDSTILKEGQPYRGIGVNYFNCFLRTITNGDDKTYDDGFATLSAKGIPFARFCCAGYWPKEMRLYQTDRKEYFRRLDAVVESAEKHRIGLIPSLFWYFACVPDLVKEPMNQWANPKSKTQAFMRDYVRDVVSRYRDRPVIWAWEFGNEYSLQANLPNAKEHRPKIHPTLGTANNRSVRDDMTFEIVRTAYIAFATEVRKHDPDRLIFTGDSFPRPAAWHLKNGGTWERDKPDQFQEIMTYLTPEPISGLCVHAYQDEDFQRLSDAMNVSRTLKKPLFVGEFGIPGDQPEVNAKCRDQLKQILDAKVPLAALWVFDLSNQKDFNILATNARSSQLDMLSEANKTLQER